MQTLAIDIETFSSTDLTKSGVYRYTEAEDFEILLFAYAVDDGPAQIVDLVQGEHLPEKILLALTSPYVLKTAHNANFERTCIRKHFKTDLPVEQWDCTMAKSTMLGLPLALDAVAKILKLEQQKESNGKALIRYFSIPCKPTKVNGGRTRNLPQHDTEKWQQFKNYCLQDVVVEQAIREKISFFTPPKTEKYLWQLDQTINDTGVMVDPQFIKNAIDLDTTHKDKLTKEAVKITGLDNPNSVAQLKQWLLVEGVSAPSLNKASIAEYIPHLNEGAVKRVLELRQEMSKTSVKKYAAMAKGRCSDNRVRGLLQYYGANRTGRWAGRLVQVQNLPRNEMQGLDMARQLVKCGDLELLDLLFESVPDALSQLVRTAFVAPVGHRFIVADFSAIEARVIAWLAGERWRLDVFNTHGKIYEASAAHMFKVPLESVTKASPLRQKGKVAELALGYQGGPNALITMGALKMGLKEEELPKLVAMWRQANRAITRYWDTVGDAAIECVQEGKPVMIGHGIKFLVDRGILFIELPSKRRLSYLRPHLRPNKFGGQSLYYAGMNQTTKQWGLQQTYGGKLVENIVQAIARDCLADAMIRLDAAHYKIALHVHDEVVMEMPDGIGSLDEALKIMGAPIPWAKGLPLIADGFETTYYKK
jgi:DNA polymerase